jgi:hypothetical protein
MSYPIIAIEINLSTPIYFSTQSFYTEASDTPADKYFQGRIVGDIDFSRMVSVSFWGDRPRGLQNVGVIELVNADGFFDSYVGESWRDTPVTIKRGFYGAAYSTFVTVAKVTVDRIEFTDELRLRLLIKDESARLEAALQLNNYDGTTANQALNGRPRPLTVGKCYQIPIQQTNVYGNGNYDLHDNENFVGVTQLIDSGYSVLHGDGYMRSISTDVYGIERLNNVDGKQTANAIGQFKTISTAINETFSNLANWTETNGGIAGRDASIVSNALLMQNTAGGADLTLQYAVATTSVDADLWFYGFTCNSVVTGSILFRINSTTERVVDIAGRYTGIFRSNGNFNTAFVALAASNAEVTIDNLVVKKISPIERLPDLISYLCTNDATINAHGYLSTGDLDSVAISLLDSAIPYRYGYSTGQPVLIADVLDQLAQSFGGWWYITRTGLLSVGRLTAPSGLPDFEFNERQIVSGVSISVDSAPGLSNKILAKRNWMPYNEGEIVSSLNYIQLSQLDIDPDITLSGDTYSYLATNTGSVRSSPGFFGEKYYFEVTVRAIDGAAQHYIGMANSSAFITNYPGSDADCVSLRANGNSYYNGSGSALGTSWVTNDVIGVAIDGTMAAAGAQDRHFRVYFRKGSTWQTANPSTDAGYLGVNPGVPNLAYLMVGANASGNAGLVNFGQTTFAQSPPDDYIAVGWQRTLVQQQYRFTYQSTTALADLYAHAVSSPSVAGSSDNTRQFADGVPTLLSRQADAITECDRWAALYSVERFFHTFDVILDTVTDIEKVEPGNVISVTYPRYGLNGTLLRVIGVEGKILSKIIRITAWG